MIEKARDSKTHDVENDLAGAPRDLNSNSPQSARDAISLVRYAACPTVCLTGNVNIEIFFCVDPFMHLSNFHASERDQGFGKYLGYTGNQVLNNKYLRTYLSNITLVIMPRLCLC